MSTVQTSGPRSPDEQAAHVAMLRDDAQRRLDAVAEKYGADSEKAADIQAHIDGLDTRFGSN